VSALAEVQRQFLAALFEAAPPRDPGVALYRDNVLAKLHDALAATYPVVRRLVGAAFFGEAARCHALATPSTSGDLNEYGGTFPDFLAAYDPARSLGYLPDVARLEWAVQESSTAADAALLDLTRLASVDPARYGELRFRVHPAVRLVSSGHPVLSIWSANQAGRDGQVDASPRGERVLVRREELVVRPVEIHEAEWMLLAAFAGGASLGEACDALEGTPQGFAPALARLASLGALASFDAPGAA
jgi:hypothetical protein